jgi:translation initiation factor IF-1
VEEEGAPGGTVVEGTVLEILPRALYRVSIGHGHDVVAHVPSGPGRNFVRLVVGDRVAVALGPQDRTRGRITRRA